jgi:ABC-2 type transport system ATP-binding protein
VKGISFDIQEGEIFSLLGPNGAGKTTSISVLSTLYAATSGDAFICGHSVTKDPMAVRRTIGVVPQDLAVYDELTARENLVFWGQMYNLSGKQLAKRVDEVLGQIGLTDRASQRVRTYSGGMKRRLNIGVGLLHKPRLLFMDEPTVGIDPQSRRAILDSVKELNQQGMTVLYTTHYMEEAQELSNRVGIIDHGELIALGTQAELTRQVGQSETLVLHVGEGEDPQALMEAVRGLEGVLKSRRKRSFCDPDHARGRRAAAGGHHPGQRTRHQDSLGRYPRAKPGSGLTKVDTRYSVVIRISSIEHQVSS